MLQGGLKGVSRKFQECFREISQIEGCFKGVLMGFKGIKRNPKVGKFQMSFKGVSRKFQGCLKKVFRVLQ